MDRRLDRAAIAAEAQMRRGAPGGDRRWTARWTGQSRAAGHCCAATSANDAHFVAAIATERSAIIGGPSEAVSGRCVARAELIDVDGEVGVRLSDRRGNSVQPGQLVRVSRPVQNRNPSAWRPERSEGFRHGQPNPARPAGHPTVPLRTTRCIAWQVLAYRRTSRALIADPADDLLCIWEEVTRSESAPTCKGSVHARFDRVDQETADFTRTTFAWRRSLDCVRPKSCSTVREWRFCTRV